MSNPSAQKLLKELEKSFERVLDRERTRLTGEKAFLKAVLEEYETRGKFTTVKFRDTFLIDELDRLQIS